jgi:quercetin dioxygenase-like cupin family protein
MIVRVGDKHAIETAPGAKRAVLCHGRRLMLTENAFRAGCQMPEHAHPHEQAIYVVRGSIKLTVDGGDPVVLAAGESCLVHPGQKHAVEALTDALVLDAFTPPRQDLLTG